MRPAADRDKRASERADCRGRPLSQRDMSRVPVPRTGSDLFMEAGWALRSGSLVSG